MNKLQQLREMTTVVADTGDIQAIRRYQPVDATTNPSLLLNAAQVAAYRPLLDEAIEWSQRQNVGDDERLELCCEKLAVNFGCEILQHIPGRVSTEVSARFSFDEQAIVDSARRIIAHYNEAGVGNERILIKTASTWEGIQAARRLEAENIQCNLTLLFGFTQARACADAGVYLISPFVGRIYDWHKAKTGQTHFEPDEDPGVQSVRRIFNYYKSNGFDTIVMGASFRNAGQVTALAGCDRLTISPQLLDELGSDDGQLERRLDATNASADDEVRTLDEAIFRWETNDDEMANDKLAEGIRKFRIDELKLIDYLRTLG